MSRRRYRQRDGLHAFKNGLAKSRAIKARHGIFAMIRIWLLAALLVLGAALPLAAREEKPAAGEEKHDEVTIKLGEKQVDAGKFAINEVQGGTLAKRITVPGSIVPGGDHIARVAVRLLGTVAELRKRLGDTVQAGEVVAVIESREVADAKSEYLAARLVFELQQTLFNRSTRLFEGKVLSENDFLRARTTFEDARVKIEIARQKLFALSLTAEQIEALPQQPVETLRQQELRAPIAGRVAERRVELGSLVGREGQESELFVIVNLDVVWADLAVPPSELASIHEGQQITIAAGTGGEPSPATIMFVSPLLDKDTRAARVVASVDNAALKWRPGSFITAEIPTDAAPAAIVVPKPALQSLNGDTVVFVRTAEGFEARKVSIGRQDGRLAEVTVGLAAGERIATANTFTLRADLGKAAAEHED
jgi:cobalt-zinc-cadmium efflux system membrane fusion protein